jgi:iron(III) transport system substrate-binding protein
MKFLVGVLLALLSTLGLALEREEMLPFAPRAQVPPGYAPAYEATVRAAENEAALVIYSTTDAAVAKYLIADFRALYPRIEVEYQDLNSTELHHRFVAETQLGGRSADVVWSSAMDQQTELVELGYAAAYDSPESANLPDWAKWKGQAFGTTFEPVAMAYNKGLLADGEVPRTRADLVRLIDAQPDRFKGKVVTYDVEKSGLGFFLAAQDAQQASAGFWDVARVLGKAAARLEPTTDAMLRRVASGQAVLAYNVLGSYALAEAARNPSIGYVFPQDYTLVVSRLMFISKKAGNPNAARLWVDYVLSKRGQSVLADKARLYAVRGDVEGELTAAHLKSVLGAGMRPVSVDPALMRYSKDPAAYRDFVLRWRRTAGAR